MKEKLLSVSEASRKSGLSGAQIRKLLGQGRLKGTKIGSYWAVPSGSLEKYMAVERKPGPRKGSRRLDQ